MPATNQNPFPLLSRPTVLRRARSRSPRAGARRGLARAFTLIEIMVVVIVIAIVAGAIVPNLGGGDSRRLAAAASGFADTLDYCYTAALSTGRVHGVMFRLGAREFEPVVEALPPSEEEQAEAAMTGAIAEESLDEGPAMEPVSIPGLVERALPEGIVFADFVAFDGSLAAAGEDADAVRLLFFPDGTTEFARIVIEDEKGERHSVRINGLTGAMSLEPVGAEEDLAATDFGISASAGDGESRDTGAGDGEGDFGGGSEESE